MLHRAMQLFVVAALILVAANALYAAPGSLQSPSSRKNLRVVLPTLGSRGDLVGPLSIAWWLKEHGHSPVVATDPQYKSDIQALGVEFARLRGIPEAQDPAEHEKILEKVKNPKYGAAYFFKTVLLPHLRDSYLDLKEVAAGADGLVSHPITYAVPILAEVMGIPWISMRLSPISFWSNKYPSTWPEYPWIRDVLRPLGAKAAAGFKELVKWKTNPWFNAIYDLRRELGLTRGKHPLFDQDSNVLNLGLFSRFLVPPRPDWPDKTVVAGFPYLDKLDRAAVPPELFEFLAAGDAPLVFTLGSSAVYAPGNFFAESVEIAKRLGRRAILLTGKGLPKPQGLTADIVAFDYIPHNVVFPKASLVVHRAGINTVGDVMRSKVPSLAVPEPMLDAPDNARLLAESGAGEWMQRKDYEAERVARKIEAIVENRAMANRARELGEGVRNENGSKNAAEHIARALGALN